MGNEPMKERFWPASIVALGIHGFVIAAMALGIPYPQGTSLQNFRAEVVFVSGSEGKKSDSQKEAHEEPTLEKITKISPTKKSSTQSEKKAAFQTTDINLSSPSSGDSFRKSREAFPIFNPPPVYPYEAKRKGSQGIVLVRLSLTETGVVDKATTLPPRIDPLLEEAALRAIYQWRFKPGARIVEVPIEFKLENN